MIPGLPPGSTGLFLFFIALMLGLKLGDALLEAWNKRNG